MASLSVDNVLGVRFIWSHTDQADILINQMHYRVNDGELPYDNATLNALELAWRTTVLPGFLSNLPDTQELLKAQFQKIAPTKELMYEYPWGGAQYPGTLARNPDETFLPQAAACLTIKTFKVGRPGIGRFFFGSLASRFYDEKGVIIPDPTLDGDLADITSAIQQTLTVTVGGSTIHLKPCVCNALGTGVTSQNDFRSVSVANVVSMIHSRKLAVGA